MFQLCLAVKTQITKILHRVGTPAHIKGYSFSAFLGVFGKHKNHYNTYMEHTHDQMQKIYRLERERDMLSCEVTEVRFYDAERGDDTIVYGLSFFSMGNSAKPLRVVDALFRKRQEATAIRTRINVNGISEIHIDDIIEDIIAETHEYGSAD